MSRLIYVPLDLTKAALCPLTFKAFKLQEHPDFKLLGRHTDTLANFEVGESLILPRQFPYLDANKHRKTATQIVTAPFGLSPTDIDLLFGLFDHLKRHPQLIAPDKTVRLTAYFLGKIAGLPTGSPEKIQRIRSRIFRLSFVKHATTIAWDVKAKRYRELPNYEFFSLHSLSSANRRYEPIVLRLSDTFVDMIESAACMMVPLDEYRSLPVALRRFYLIAQRQSWKQRKSMIYNADQFCVNQLGFHVDHDAAKDRKCKRDRMRNLNKLLAKAEQCDMIVPCKKTCGYVQEASTDPLSGKLALRWSRGPLLRTKATHSTTSVSSVANDPLYDEVCQLQDQQGKPMHAVVFRKLLEEHDRHTIEKQLDIILAQKQVRPGSFAKSEVAALIDSVKNDYAPPAWYSDFQRAKRLIDFDQPSSAATEELYQAISHS